MITPPTAPSPGKPVSAGFFARLIAWVKSGQLIDGQGYRLHRTPNGTTLEIKPGKRDRKTAAALHPWKVFAFAKREDRDSCFEIYVPETALHVGEDLLEVGDITPVEDHDDRYTLDCESEISGSAVIYLAVVKYEPEEGEEAQWEAHVVSTLESIEDAVEVLVVLPIAKLSIDASGEYEVGKVDAQYAHSSVAFENPDEEEDKQKTPAPFDIAVTETEDPDTHEKTKTIGVANRHFYWDGELKEADVEGELLQSGTGTIYLCCTKPAPSSSGEQPWEFKVDDEESEAMSGEKVLNFKLYDIEDYNVTMDYRTTFLSLNSGDAEQTVLPFDGKATKNDRGQFVIGMETGYVVGASGNTISVSLEDGIVAARTIRLYAFANTTSIPVGMRYVASDTQPSQQQGETLAFRMDLFSVSDSGVVTQKFHGVLVHGGLSLKGETVTGKGESKTVFQSANVKGESGSGLNIRSYAGSYPGAPDTIAIDITGRGKYEEFGVREVKNSSGSTIAKVFGTSGFSVGGDAAPDLDVLKDIELKYDTDTHYFTAKKTTVNLKTKAETVGSEETIFTAAPHFQNESPATMTGAQFEQ